MVGRGEEWRGRAGLSADNADLLVEPPSRGGDPRVLGGLVGVEAVAAEVDGAGRRRLEGLLDGLGARDVERRRRLERGRHVVTQGTVGEEGEALARVDRAGLGEERHFSWVCRRWWGLVERSCGGGSESKSRGQAGGWVFMRGWRGTEWHVGERLPAGWDYWESCLG